MLVRPARRKYRTRTLDSRFWNGYVARLDDIITTVAQVRRGVGPAVPRAGPPVAIVGVRA
jgi:hypothetical protein